MDRNKLQKILEKHKKWLNYENGGERANLKGADLRHADLRNADLIRSDLTYANLRGADLNGADLDFSCLPLWCGSLLAHFDDKQIIQLCYHVVKAGLQSKNTSDETKAELSKLVDFANKFHRVEECGKIEINNKISDAKEEAWY